MQKMMRRVWSKVSSVFGSDGSASVGCSESEDMGGLSREVISSLVYDKLRPRIRHISDLDVWLSHNYSESYWEPMFAQIQRTIVETRLWAKANTSGTVRSEYLQWLTYFFQNGLDDARKELRDKHTKTEMEQYDRRNRDHSAAAARVVGFPAPPEKVTR